MSLVVLLVLVACARDVAAPGLPAGAVALSVRSASPVVAAQFTVEYTVGEVRFLGLAAVRPSVLARAYDDGAGNVRVALVSAEAVDGALVAAVFDGDEARQVMLTDVDSYARDGSVASSALSLRASGGPIAEKVGPQARGASWFPADTQATLAPQDVSAPALNASYADHPLGDLDQNDAIDVLDVLLDLDIATGAASGDDYQRYSGDLIADDAIDAADVVRLLDKAVDPTLEAALTVKPSSISYVSLTEGVPVLVGNSGNTPLAGLQVAPSSGVHGSVTNGIQNQSAAFTFSGDPNENFGAVEVSASGDSTTVPVGNVVVLVAGQSNAEGQGLPMTNRETAVDEGVRMLGNDYVWKLATEPLDSSLGQLDGASEDSGPLHSFGVRLGNHVRTATGRHVYLIPAALGGSSLTGNGNNVHGWDPNGVVPVYNRGYLSGSAVYRGHVSAGLRPNPATNAYPAEGGPVRAVAWYQGASDSRSNTIRSNFITVTKRVFSTFTAQFDGAPIIYAQLAPHGEEAGDSEDASITKNLEQADIAERQRRMEAGAAQFGTAATEPQTPVISPVANAYMVVTHDLPMSDHVHLSAEGQRILGDRIALAVEEHVLGLNVDGTGPRLVSITRPSATTIKVKTTRTINSESGPSAYEGYFTVFDGVPSGSDIESAATYGTNTLAIQNIQRDPGDSTAVLITLATPPTATPYVRYMPPSLRPFDANGGTSRLTNVVQDASTGLPLPSFGPLAAQ